MMMKRVRDYESQWMSENLKRSQCHLLPKRWSSHSSNHFRDLSTIQLLFGFTFGPLHGKVGPGFSCFLLHQIDESGQCAIQAPQLLENGVIWRWREIQEQIWGNSVENGIDNQHHGLTQSNPKRRERKIYVGNVFYLRIYPSILMCSWLSLRWSKTFMLFQVISTTCFCFDSALTTLWLVDASWVSGVSTPQSIEVINSWLIR